jgi:FtsH-binding integral membrane protein
MNYRKLVAPAAVAVIPNLLHTLDALKAIMPESAARWVQLVAGLVGVVWAFATDPQKGVK